MTKGKERFYEIQKVVHNQTPFTAQVIKMHLSLKAVASENTCTWPFFYFIYTQYILQLFLVKDNIGERLLTEGNYICRSKQNKDTTFDNLYMEKGVQVNHLEKFLIQSNSKPLASMEYTMLNLFVLYDSKMFGQDKSRQKLQTMYKTLTRNDVLSISEVNYRISKGNNSREWGYRSRRN